MPWRHLRWSRAVVLERRRSLRLSSECGCSCSRTSHVAGPTAQDEADDRIGRLNGLESHAAESVVKAGGDTNAAYFGGVGEGNPFEFFVGRGASRPDNRRL
jgi:hypothetical protein